MEDEDEQTMQMAADIARSRRSVELRRRQIKVYTADGSTQTVRMVQNKRGVCFTQKTKTCISTNIRKIKNK